MVSKKSEYITMCENLDSGGDDRRTTASHSTGLTRVLTQNANYVASPDWSSYWATPVCLLSPVADCSL